MKLYYIKIGNMYIIQIYLGKEKAENYFIDDIELGYDKDYAYKIYENEINRYEEILKYVLKIDNGSINFEETESEENK